MVRAVEKANFCIGRARQTSAPLEGVPHLCFNAPPSHALVSPPPNMECVPFVRVLCTV